ncbi:MAG: DUF3971 domain-containing protein [Pseudomonadota bacterium]
MLRKAIVSRALVLSSFAFVAMLVVAFGAMSAIVVRINIGPMNAQALRPFVENAILRAFPQAVIVDIGSIEISKDDPQDLVILTLGDLEIGGQKSAGATVKSVKFGFDLRDILRLRIGPQSVLVQDAGLRIVRRKNAVLGLDYGGAVDLDQNSGSLQADDTPFQALSDAPHLPIAFQHIAILGLQVSFLDEATGRAWTATDASLDVKQKPTGYIAELQGNFLTSQNQLDAALKLVADYNADAGLISSELSLQHAPVGDILSVYLGAPESIVTGLVSGEAAITLTRGGRVLNSFIDAEAIGGELNLGSKATNVQRISLDMNFDAENTEFLINTLDLKSDALSTRIDGVIAARPGRDDNGYESVSFGLNANDTKVTAGTALERDVVLDKIEISGAYNFQGRRGHLNDILIELYGARGTGELHFAAFDDDTPELIGEIAFDKELTRDEVLSIWPKDAAFAARKFVNERVTRAKFSKLKAVLNLQGGMLNNGAIMPEEAMALSFQVSDAKVFYAPTKSPITDLAGRGVLAGNSFTLDADRGRVGKVVLNEGRVVIPRLRPKGAMATFTFVAEGDSGDMLGILDQEPLKVLQNTSFVPEDFRGDGVVSAEIQRPNQKDAPPESYRYKAKASVTDITVHNFFEDTPLTNTSANIDLETEGMTVTGNAKLAESPVQFTWKQKFRGTENTTRIDLKGRLDPQLGDLFGLPVRQFIRGEPAFSARAKGTLTALEKVSLDADFTDHLIVLEAFSWRKPSGTPADGTLSISFGQNAPNAFALQLAGEDVDIDGEIKLSDVGAMEALSVKRLHLGDLIDVSLKASRTSGPLDLTVDGKMLDLSGAIHQLGSLGNTGSANTNDDVAQSGPNFSRLLSNTIGNISLDAIKLKSGVVLSNSELQFTNGPDRLKAFSLTASPGGTGELKAFLETDGDDDTDRRIVAQTSDLGALFSGLLGMQSIRGGRGRFSFILESPIPLHEDPYATDEVNSFGSPPATGVITASDIRVVGAPLLARIFSAGSLTGLGDLLSGEGIEIANASVGFALKDRKVELLDARVNGPSVGLTAQGEFMLGDTGNIDITGAVAPAYQINSILGSAPLIGDLLINRTGEGVVAVSYAVSGTPQNPTIAVNPLSALTPGFLRRIFEADGAVARATSSTIKIEPTLKNRPTDIGPENISPE